MATVLVADDEKNILQLARMYLQAEGFTVETAGNGREALEKVKQAKPDLLVLDLMMPEVDGWQFIRAWREDPAISGIPIIVVSAAYEAARRAELGSLVFLTKPVDPTMLLLLLEDAISSAKGRRVSPS